MPTWSADSQASPRAAWALMSRPRAWPAWAPHIRGAVGLGRGEVEQGATGCAGLLGVVPVPVRVADKDPGRSWTWLAPGVTIVHRVIAREEGCRVAVELDGPLAPLLALTYGPVIQLSLNRLARIAVR